MDYESYRKKYFVQPAPKPKYAFAGILGATLYYQDYAAALAFFEQVFGPPAYVEGEHTHGWQIGEGWLTVFPSRQGNPTNVEIPIYVQTPAEVDRLYAGFLAAGATGTAPEDVLMYQPVRSCILTDLFGVEFMIVCVL